MTDPQYYRMEWTKGCCLEYFDIGITHMLGGNIYLLVTLYNGEVF